MLWIQSSISTHSSIVQRDKPSPTALIYLLVSLSAFVFQSLGRMKNPTCQGLKPRRIVTRRIRHILLVIRPVGPSGNVMQTFVHLTILKVL